MDFYDDPEKVKHAVNVITNMMIEYVDALIETGVHANMIDTLFASKSVMSKKMWIEFEGAYVNKIAKHVHQNNCMLMVHNCGDVIYFDAQIEMMHPEAISYLHIPDDCKNHQEVKEKYGDIITLIGHIPPTWLTNASKEDVINECKKQIDELKENGGFILATGCEYPANLSLEHAQTIVDCAIKYGQYD